MLYKGENLQSLAEIIDKIKSKNFSIETQYKFLKINQAVIAELEIFAQQKDYLIQTYGEIDEQGKVIMLEDGRIKIKNECLEECAAKIREINDMQVTIPDLYFSLDELEPLGLTLGELMLLEPFIKS